MPSLIIAFAVITAVAAAAFVAVAVLWLRKLRANVTGTLGDISQQQARVAQRLGDAVAHMQKQQRAYEQQLHNLAQANMRLRQELAT
ncbi:MAG TPA: hypothetical protein VMV79_01575, partial [Alphaproteobacteria bacterium]|nr:hypothetical protein [Alphaproteobacteria bacterium]